MFAAQFGDGMSVLHAHPSSCCMFAAQFGDGMSVLHAHLFSRCMFAAQLATACPSCMHICSAAACLRRSWRRHVRLA